MVRVRDCMLYRLPVYHRFETLEFEIPTLERALIRHLHGRASKSQQLVNIVTERHLP